MPGRSSFLSQLSQEPTTVRRGFSRTRTGTDRSKIKSGCGVKNSYLDGQLSAFVKKLLFGKIQSWGKSTYWHGRYVPAWTTKSTTHCTSAPLHSCLAETPPSAPARMLPVRWCCVRVPGEVPECTLVCERTGFFNCVPSTTRVTQLHVALYCS